MANESTASTNKETVGSDSASTSYNNYPEMSAEQEFFLYELETTDSGSIGLVLRAIYDTGDVHKFARALERRIAHYDKSILKVSTYHYQGFMDSMKQLSGLGDKCLDIKGVTETIDSNVQEMSAELLKKSTEIVRYRKLQRNANTAIDQITMCLPILENYAKLQSLMKQKKYYQALKVLEELEHTYLSHIQKYRFTQSLAKSMAPIRDQIREKSYSELTDFLESLQKISRKIGEEVLKKTAEHHQIFKPDKNKDLKQKKSSSTPRDTEFEISKDGSLMKKSPRNSENSLEIHQRKEESLSAQDKIDFAPIHRCCQIFNVLGDKERFEVYYRNQRREQSMVVNRPPVKLQESIDTYVRYLQEIVGFFVVEDNIMQMQPGLVTAAHKDQLWEMALQQITHTMNSHFVMKNHHPVTAKFVQDGQVVKKLFTYFGA
uniref:Exocyst complex component 6 n=1 Tax=Acrobeloides nanus TaxID=290746 RepID=A0A914CIF4_9BILA